MIKFILIIISGMFVLLSFFSCKSNNPSLLYNEDNYKFFVQHIIGLDEIPETDYFFIFTINTSFCGSCTEKTVAYIHSPIFTPYSKAYITDVNGGDIVEKIKVIPNSKQLIVSINDQERAGIFSTYNKVYIIKNKEIIFANYLVDSTLKEISKYVENL